MREDVEEISGAIVVPGDIQDAVAPMYLADAFKNSMRNLAASVAVVTVRAGDDAAGFTATSIISLSMDPPTLLVSINRTSSCWPLVQRSGRFAVNILSSAHREVADTFAGRRGLSGNDRYVDPRWQRDASQIPRLVDALAVIECDLEEVLPRYSHAILIGRVLNASCSNSSRPLVYWQGEYNGLSGLSDNI
ncbi:MAG: flavin reductase family protein [Candidatus Devosia phytovorans]|uniref:Flavin reductase family protein n=1 Tax=Candidatus Devosia phytovorans TaxID=3121372 RepID=A0AAJ6AYL7_9HYPH|nr:flavin reductase family protein [Devosia sp.]WEK03725.1 MAG: flavin reductase family protein [Devosia sp.]